MSDTRGVYDGNVATTAASRRRYLMRTSASLDPYALHDNDGDRDGHTAQQVQLLQWVSRVQDEMCAHRSPFIAAEVVLRQMRVCATAARQPDTLYLATVLPVLQHCLPALAPDAADVLHAAVHELLPAIFFTRAVAPPPAVAAAQQQQQGGSSCAPLLTDVYMGHVFARHAYATCFADMYARYVAYTHTRAAHARRARIEAAVMDRVAHKLGGLWLKMCFFSWRIHCNKMAKKKELFRKLAQHGTSAHVLPMFLRRWRQYAHALTLRAKTTRSTALTRELEALYPIELTMKSQHEKLSQAIVEKLRHVQAATRAADETRERLAVLQQLYDETQHALRSHWRVWRRCMRLLFADAQHSDAAAAAAAAAADDEDDEDSHAAFALNITDTAALYARRARARTDRIGARHIQRLLRSMCAGALTRQRGGAARHTAAITAAASSSSAPPSASSSSASLMTHMMSSSSSTPVTTTMMMMMDGVGGSGSSSSSSSSGAVVRHALQRPERPLRVDGVAVAVAVACFPVVSPLRLVDLLHDNQARMRLVTAFLTCIASGGHCSLFALPLPQRIRDDDSVSDGDGDDIAGECGDDDDGRSARAAKAMGRTADVDDDAADNNDNDDNDKDDTQPLQLTRKKPNESDSDSDVDDDDDDDDDENACSDGELSTALPSSWDGCGERMVQDIERGMEQLSGCNERNEEYLRTVRRCMTGNELELTHDVLGAFFARASVLSLPLSRDKIEAVTCSIVAEEDYPVIYALYPAERGICTFGELVNYLTRVAEFSSWPLLSVAEKLISHYAMDARDELLLSLYEPDVVTFLRDNAEHMDRLFRRIRDDQAPVVAWDKARVVLVEQLGLTAAEADEALRSAGGDRERVDKDEMDQLLYAAAQIMQPSPFVPPVEKLACALDKCLPFLLDM